MARRRPPATRDHHPATRGGGDFGAKTPRGGAVAKHRPRAAAREDPRADPVPERKGSARGSSRAARSRQTLATAAARLIPTDVDDAVVAVGECEVRLTNL